MKRILIIDDEKDFAETLKQYFEESKNDVVFVEDDPERALTSAHKNTRGETVLTKLAK